MSFTFQPMTEEQIKLFSLMDAGTYDFEVLKATETSSKAGNQMIKLDIKVWDRNGKEHYIFDYLVSTPNMMYKIKHFCEAIGMQREYLDGKFEPQQCEKRVGKAEIYVKKGDPKQEGGSYPDKNAIKDYIPKSINQINNEPKKEFVDDDLPF